MKNVKVVGKNELALVENVFEGCNVEIIMLDGEPLFELYSTGMALGQVVVSKGNNYPNKKRIDNNIRNAGISTVLRNAKQYLTEDMLYDFMLETGTDKCKAFRKWVVTELLPELRKHGMYIMDNATEEQKLFNYKMIKSTFNNCGIEKLAETYRECMKYYKDNKIRIPMRKSQHYRSDKKLSYSDTKLRVMRDIKDIVEKRSMEYEENKQFALSSICDDVVKIIMEDYSTLKQRISGGKNAFKTKVINEINPSMDKYDVLNCHGMSENYLYEKVIDENTGEQVLVKTNAYKNWIKHFPAHELKDKYEIDIDWEEDIVIYLKFDCLDKFDVQNLSKSAIDQIITRCYGENDSIVVKVVTERNNIINNYEEGKIYVCLRNL